MANPEEAELIRTHPWIVWNVFERVYRCQGCGTTMPEDTSVADFVIERVHCGKASS
jgi:hypothetical protein